MGGSNAASILMLAFFLIFWGGLIVYRFVDRRKDKTVFVEQKLARVVAEHFEGRSGIWHAFTFEFQDHTLLKLYCQRDDGNCKEGAIGLLRYQNQKKDFLSFEPVAMDTSEFFGNQS